MMVALRKVGFFRELPYGESNAPSIKTARTDAEPRPDLQKILRYLRSGRVLISSPSLSFDVISNENKPIGPIAIITDGVWAWPRELAFYVEKYGISVPLAFVKHMEDASWTIGEFDLLDLSIY